MTGFPLLPSIPRRTDPLLSRENGVSLTYVRTLFTHTRSSLRESSPRPSPT